jgi:hypothetical protein
VEGLKSGDVTPSEPKPSRARDSDPLFEREAPGSRRLVNLLLKVLLPLAGRPPRDGEEIERINPSPRPTSTVSKSLALAA